MALIDWTILIPVGVLLIATICDLRTREIPDTLSLVLIGWGLLAKLLGWITLPWLALGLGVVLGLATTLPFFWAGGLGGGDVKLIVALGLVIGPVGLTITLFGMALAGGGLALLAFARGQKDYAYVPAILAGLLLCILCEVYIGKNLV
ncbi:prepilin peptidase [Blastopirellula marina]|uniref:Prepilin type IV endopeptidase peptidase domain-containing protein n=1 Tax=Blastopirellula marina TaxID=124 RepID=A0A2S8G153_9BACT|nr:A24 family peptidase [Blastopirellula marina]PQO38040.1 hypothetical protein C5Y98_08115 [Blastopirellula marina]PTL44696.1 prepilin peptidase [Blastopirellula marina]